MHLRVQGTPQTGVDGAMSPLGGLRERRLLTCLPLNADRVVATSTLLADRRAAIRTGREGMLRRVSGWAWKSASVSDRRSATTGGLRARCRRPSPSARWVSG
ncbi:hypothetical protein [Streptomyces platensis]|uniref:hypothetical protein n=1 Tax=Streptomyces platensis TaxID=58346 RepID=UPI002E2702E0